MSTLLELIAARMENVKPQGDGSIIGGCPACIKEGHDSKKAHLKVFPNGAFSCVANDSVEHHRFIRSALRSTNEDIVEIFYAPEEKVQLTKVYPESILDNLLCDYSYWVGRGISEDILRKIGGGVAPKNEKSKLSGRFIFPCRNDKGQIIGFAGRLIEENSFSPKWKILGKKSDFIFSPVSISDPAIRAKSEIILVESQGCVLSLMNAGLNNCYCLFGVKLSSKLVSKIIGLSPNRVIVATNNEASNIGNDAAVKIKSQLSSFISEDKILIRLPSKKDFNCMGVDEIKEWYSKI